METTALRSKLLYDTRPIKRLHKKLQDLEQDPSDINYRIFLVELESMKYTLKKNGLYSAVEKEEIDFDEKQREIDELQLELEQRMAQKELEKDYDHLARLINKIHSREHTEKNRNQVREEIAALESQISNTNDQIARMGELYKKMNNALLDIEKDLQEVDQDSYFFY
jgi:multidrug resistance efflux pump